MSVEILIKLQTLSPDNLLLAIEPEIVAAFERSDSLKISKMMATRAYPDAMFSNVGMLWKGFCVEFCEFVYGDHPRYEKDREHISKLEAESETVAVAIISASIGGTIGIVWGVLVPFVSALLLQLAKMGRSAFKNTYCISNFDQK